MCVLFVLLCVVGLCVVWFGLVLCVMCLVCLLCVVCDVVFVCVVGCGVSVSEFL